MENETQDKPWYYWLLVNLQKRTIGAFNNFRTGRPVLFWLLVLLLLVVLFVNRPLLHTPFLFVRKYFLIILLLTGLGLIVRWWFSRSKTLGRIIIGASFLLVLAGSMFYGSDIYRYIGMYMHFQLLPRQELSEVPITRYERIQPFESIATLVEQEGLSETEESTDPRLVRNAAGDYVFSMGVGPSPDYTFQLYSKNQYEIIASPALSAAPDFSGKYRTEIEFDVGDLLVFSRSTVNNAIRAFNFLQYFSYEPAESCFIERSSGDWVQAVSLIKWEGWLIPRPVFGGVLIIEPMRGDGTDYFERIATGKGAFMSADSVQNVAYLQGQNLLPVEASRYMADCFRFQHGFMAPFPGYHENDIRIPTLLDDQLQQPFVIHFEGLAKNGKLYHYYGLEPFQETKRGLNNSVIIPADGQEAVYYYDHSEKQDAYMGSSAVGFKIKESRKNYDWTLNLPAETRPIIREVRGNNRFFWLSTIVTRSAKQEGRQSFGGSIPDVTITDARTGYVIWLDKEVIPDQARWMDQVEKELATLLNE